VARKRAVDAIGAQRQRLSEQIEHASTTASEVEPARLITLGELSDRARGRSQVAVTVHEVALTTERRRDVQSRGSELAVHGAALA
jgi:hypothetical protein